MFRIGYISLRVSQATFSTLYPHTVKGHSLWNMEYENASVPQNA